MARGTLAVGESLATVKNPHVIDEAEVSAHHARLELVLARDEVHGIEGLCLGFGKARDVGAAGVERGVADEEAAGEGHDDFGVVVEEDGAGVVGGFAEEAAVGEC